MVQRIPKAAVIFDHASMTLTAALTVITVITSCSWAMNQPSNAAEIHIQVSESGLQGQDLQTLASDENELFITAIEAEYYENTFGGDPRALAADDLNITHDAFSSLDSIMLQGSHAGGTGEFAWLTISNDNAGESLSFSFGNVAVGEEYVVYAATRPWDPLRTDSADDSPDNRYSGQESVRVDTSQGTSVSLSLSQQEAAGLDYVPLPPGAERPPAGPTVLWSYQTELPIQRDQALTGTVDGTVYASARWELSKLDSDGNLQWVFSEGNDLSHASIGANGHIVVHERGPSNNGTFYFLDPNTGNDESSFFTGSMTATAPAVASDGTVYVGTNFADSDQLYAFDPDGLSIDWSYTTEPTGITAAPVIDADGNVYVVGQNGNLFALNSEGELRWQVTYSDGISSGLSLGADATLYFGTFGGELVAKETATGAEIWATTLDTDDTVRTAPAIDADGTLYVGSNNTNLYAVNPDGSILWVFTEPEDALESSPAIGDDGTVYVGSLDRNLYAVSAQDGEKKWAFAASDEIRSSPLIATDGTVYFGTGGGAVYALSTDSGGPADTPWPMLGQNPQRTGRQPSGD